LFAAVIASTLLAVGMTGNTVQPVALRHRRGVITDRTIFAVTALVVLAFAVIALTRPQRFAADDPDDLRAQLPRLGREAGRYPNHFRSQYVFGNGLNKSRDCASALAPLQRAVALDSSDGWALNDLGFALSCRYRYAEAVSPYLASVRLLPDERLPRYGLAWALEQTRASSAEREYRAILGRWPGDPFARAREATLRYNRGERTEGLTEMRQALAIDSSYWVRLAAAQLFSSAALMSEALAQYRALATRDSANLWMWAHYGSAAYLAGELAEARRAFDHADSIDRKALDAVAAWRDMRDASRRGVPPSGLPPIAPYQNPKR
jgi:Flp pilus assembly protein TadD